MVVSAYGRRRMLKGLAAAALLPLRLARAAAQGAPRPLLHAKPVPSTGQMLPVIGLGTVSAIREGVDPAQFAALLPLMQAFFDHGGEVIDSSPRYGWGEDVIGRLLAQTRHGALFAATKVWTDGAAAGVAQIKESRRAWGVPRFDLIQIHDLRDWQVHLPVLQEMKARGDLHYIGVTTSDGRMHEELESLLRTGAFDFMQLTYNVEERTAERRLLPLAAELGVAVIANRPFGKAALFAKVRGKALPPWAAEIDCASWAQYFLKFIVSQPQIVCAIPATARLDHLLDNMAAGRGRLPDAAMRRRMSAHLAAL